MFFRRKSKKGPPPPIEVLKPGKTSDQRFYVGECPSCGAEVRFREDAALPAREVYRGRKVVWCPTRDCHRWIEGRPERRPDPPRAPPPMEDWYFRRSR